MYRTSPRWYRSRALAPCAEPATRDTSAAKNSQSKGAQLAPSSLRLCLAALCLVAVALVPRSASALRTQGPGDPCGIGVGECIAVNTCSDWLRGGTCADDDTGGSSGSGGSSIVTLGDIFGQLGTLSGDVADIPSLVADKIEDLDLLAPFTDRFQTFNSRFGGRLDLGFITSLTSSGSQLLTIVLEEASTFFDGTNYMSCNNTCRTFRAKLITFVTDVENIHNDIVGPNVFDLAPVRRMIGSAPPLLLFPAYLGVERMGAGTVFTTLRTLATDIVTLKSVTEAGLSGGTDAVCAYIDGNQEAYSGAIRRTAMTAGSLMLVGKLLQAAGKTEIAPTVSGGLGAEAGARIKVNKVAMVGKLLDGIGTVGGKMATIGTLYELRCELRADFDVTQSGIAQVAESVAAVANDVEDNYQDLKAEHGGLLTAVGLAKGDILTELSRTESRAANDLSSHDTAVSGRFDALGRELAGTEVALLASIDAHGVAVDNTLNSLSQQVRSTESAITAGIDTHHAGMQSQVAEHDSSVQAKLDEQHQKWLRVRIEESLADKRVVVAYFLPEEQGGHLETVADVVAGAIAAVQTAGYDVSAAGRSFADGEAARAAGAYREAYDEYQKAYESLLSGR